MKQPFFVISIIIIFYSLPLKSQDNNPLINYNEAFNLTEEKEPGLYNPLANLVDGTGNPERALQIYNSAIIKYPACSSLFDDNGQLKQPSCNYFGTLLSVEK